MDFAEGKLAEVELEDELGGNALEDNELGLEEDAGATRGVPVCNLRRCVCPPCS